MVILTIFTNFVSLESGVTYFEARNKQQEQQSFFNDLWALLAVKKLVVYLYGWDVLYKIQMTFYSYTNFEFWTFWTRRFHSGSVCSDHNHILLGYYLFQIIIVIIKQLGRKIFQWILSE